MKLFKKLLLSLSILSVSLFANSFSSEAITKAIAAIEILSELDYTKEVLADSQEGYKLVKDALDVFKEQYIEALKKDYFTQDLYIAEVRKLNDENPFVEHIKMYNTILTEVYFMNDEEVESFCNGHDNKALCFKNSALVKKEYYLFRDSVARAFFLPY